MPPNQNDRRELDLAEAEGDDPNIAGAVLHPELHEVRKAVRGGDGDQIAPLSRKHHPVLDLFDRQAPRAGRGLELPARLGRDDERKQGEGSRGSSEHGTSLMEQGPDAHTDG